MMDQDKPKLGKEIWKVFLRRHWKMCVLAVAGIALAAIGAVLVFLWFAASAQSTGLVPSTLGLWAMGHLVTFLLNLILWEILFVGIPIIAVAAIVYLMWWRRLGIEEREEYKRGRLFSGTGSRRSDGQGALSFLVFIAFIIKIYLDGNWNTAFATWTFDYFVYSCIWALVWILVIFGIPLALGGTWWLRREIRKES